MPRIFDNLAAETQLGLALRTHFTDSYTNVDVATGYLDLRGWSHLGDVMEGKAYESGSAPVARVLVGMVAPSESQAILDSLQSELSDDGPGESIHDSSKALDQNESPRRVRRLRTLGRLESCQETHVGGTPRS